MNNTKQILMSNSHFTSNTTAKSIFSNAKLCRSSVRTTMRFRQHFWVGVSDVGCKFNTTKPHDLTRNAHSTLEMSISANDWCLFAGAERDNSATNTIVQLRKIPHNAAVRSFSLCEPKHCQRWRQTYCDCAGVFCCKWDNANVNESHITAVCKFVICDAPNEALSNIAPRHITI